VVIGDQASIAQRTFLTYLQEIHQKGLDEVARIEEEMKEILEEMGFSNLTLPQFIDMIRYVASFKFVTYVILVPLAPTQCCVDADPGSTYHPDADLDSDFGLMRIRIRLFTLMRIRIQTLASK
jgi:hypothetical protein